MRRIRSVWLCGLSALVLLVTACNVDTAEPDTVEEDPDAAPEDPPEEADEPDDTPDEGLDLASVCPDPIVLQTNWTPQSSEGYFYGLIPIDQGEFDTDTQVLTGPAAADPSVAIEIRHGGPAIGFQDVTSILYSDPETLLTTGNMDAMISQSGEFPTVAVYAPYVKHPFALQYGVEAFPEGIETFDDIRESGATVLVAEHQTYARGLIGLGALDADQVDFSFDFSPARFVAAEGRQFQSAFGHVDPYQYQFDIEEWDGPTDVLYVADGGYPNYRVVFARADAIEEHSDCFERLVPAFQQAWVDYFEDFEGMNAAIVSWNEAAGNVAASIETYNASAFAAFEDGLVGDGPSGYMGEIEEEKVETLFEIAMPIFEEMGARVDPDLVPQDLFTNEFMDQTIQTPPPPR